MTEIFRQGSLDLHIFPCRWMHKAQHLRVKRLSL